MSEGSSLTAVSLKVDAETIALYADVTDDQNPLHLDPEFAAKTAMGGVIAHGTMSLALILQSLAASFDAQRVDTAKIDVRFVAPVRIGDVVTAGGEPDPETAGQYVVWVRNGAGEDVIRGWAVL